MASLPPLPAARRSALVLGACTSLALLAFAAQASAAGDRNSEPRPLSPAPVTTAPPAEQPPVLMPPVERVRPAGVLSTAAASTPFDSARAERVVPSSERRELGYQTEADGTTWVRGRTFKASFGARGVSYIPYFGAQAPRNYPVDLGLASARIAGAPLELAPIGQPLRDKDRFTFDRGLIDEVYDVKLDSVEQSFVIERNPGLGALDLFVALESDLELGLGDAGVELAGDLGSVRYGDAFALLADGSRAPLETTLVEGGVSIHLDAVLLASAHYPLVVDPVVTTFTVDNFGTVQVESDLSYDVSNDRYLIAWEEVFSATDGDVYMQLRGSNGTYHGAGFIDGTSQDWRSPQTANLNNYDQFLCVAQVRNFPGVANYAAIGVTLAAATGVQGFPFLISTNDMFGDKFTPDVGGDPYLGTAYYCVVWQRNYLGERDIHARLVRNDGTLVGAGTILIDNTIGAIDGWPGISKSNGQLGGAAAWTIAWHRQNATYDLYAARLSYGGSILNASTLIAASGQDDYYPRVSSPRTDGRVCVVYARNYGTDHDLLYVTLDGVTGEASGSLSALDSNTWFQDQIEYSVDSDGERFLVTFCENKISNPADYDVRATAVVLMTPTNLRVTESRVVVDDTSSNSLRTDTASQWGSGASSRMFRISYDSPDSGGDNDIFGADFERQLGGGYEASCLGDNTASACPCSNFGALGRGCANSAQSSGARLSCLGAAQTNGGDTLLFTLTGVPSGAPTLLFQGTSGGTFGGAFGDGILCVGGSIIRMSVKFSDASGAAAWPTGADLPISVAGGVVPAVGGDRTYQAYYRDAASFCTGATFNLSNGMSVLWLP